ncbi:MAG: LLM class F420-dependent oxidoreductase [Acidimicrobiales bacterium]
MELGLVIFPTDYSIGPVELARAAEERGFESLWFPEHTHIPVSRRTPYPGGGELPREYSHTLDPFVALAAAAVVTRRLLLGTGVCLVMERDPITLAKEAASVDHLSGGRLLLGVGGGWNREEMEDHGTDPRRRWALLRERVLAMRAIWTEDEASYHGELVDFDPLWSWPKPAQPGGPPIVVGGSGPSALDRVLDYGDQWMPIMGRPGGEGLAPRIAELQRRAAGAGRGEVPVSVYGAPHHRQGLEELAGVGVSRAVLWLPSEGEAETVARLDRWAELIGG